MHAPGLLELGRRLGARRQEARLEVATLAGRARLTAEALERFERGEGGLSLAALSRLARVLGVDSGQFFHTSAPESVASMSPHVLLKQRGSVELEESDQEALAEGLVRARSFTELGRVLGVERLAEHIQPSAAPQREAYEEGYRWALRVRELLPERTRALSSLGRLIENRFDILVLSHPFRSREVLGASCRTGEARLIAVSAHLESKAQRRFVLAHELAHQLLDLGAEDVETDLGPQLEPRRFWLDNPPAERRANAFAAMLLAPAPAVRELLGPPMQATGAVEARGLVDQARRYFGLSFTAMTWHLRNLGYVAQSTVDLLLMTADPTDVSGFEQDTRFNGLQRRVMECLSRELMTRGRARELLGQPVEELMGELGG